ncbi:hypothetical protein [Vulcanisaeta thermophila]|uniref:hypothetical protein n=1 Tax=Vulcanisaeta thermophila TaxID=867917 RepID=UPI000853E6DF|nr:hypothetical protein [Vulcanisaeta thermophila]
MQGRYVILSFLDSVLTTLVISEFIYDVVKTIVVVVFINMVTAFMAEYAEERSNLDRIERALLVRRGSLLRTSLHRKAVVNALVNGLVYGAVSLLGTVITEFSIGLALIYWVPLIPIVILGIFGALMSRYFHGNYITWSLIYILLGLLASYIRFVLA